MEAMKNKPKVAYILGRFPSIHETFVINEIVGLLNNNLDIHIFSLGYPKSQGFHETIHAYNLINRTYYFRYRYLVLLGLKGYLKFFFAIFEAFGRLSKNNRFNLRNICAIAYFSVMVQKIKIEHIHVHFIHFWGSLIASISNIPASYTIHSNWDIINFFKTVPKNLSDIYRDISLVSPPTRENLQPWIKKAVGLRCISNFVKRATFHFGGKNVTSNIQTIYNGIDLEKFNWFPPHSNSEHFLILHVGSIIPCKGLYYLLEAAKILKSEGFDFHIQIITGKEMPGSMEEEHTQFLLKYIEENSLQDAITFIHTVKQEKLNKIMKEASCMILPCIETNSIHVDGLPNVLTEACAVGLPVITTDISGIPELIISDETGIVVPRKNSFAIAKAIRHLYSEPEFSVMISKRARQRVENLFDIKITSPKMAWFIQELLLKTQR